MALSACTTAREREARSFVHWDAMSDARSSARDECDGDVALIEGAEGLSMSDYLCRPQASALEPEPVGFIH